MQIGVLALQGDFREHRQVLEKLGTSTCSVRRPDDLNEIEGLIIPGGESTTISKLLRKWDLFEPIQTEVRKGLPVFGTCAGLILLAMEVENGPPTLELLDITVERNSYGRQIESFESRLEVTNGLIDRDFQGVFIRAPRVKRVGPGVEVLARYGDDPVFLRNDNVLAATFHPELTDDNGIHEYFLREAVGKSSGVC
ncbi:pyridoxal 5'-phosphate synthase glutaminase subunit PdxT [Candidatus Bipolaricaulota bacterium]|nr:pyridoxal 5'-phosphate synthase glutaminase subunit PdxT [Candidatus Bipolaricaulota bacterium]